MAYDSFDRRRCADAHLGTPQRFLDAHRQEAHTAAIASKAERSAFAGLLLKRTADERNIKLALDHLRREGGDAPGPDGTRPSDIGTSDAWGIARALRDAILSGTYRPGPERCVKIPKASGGDHRTISVQNVTDRAVQRAIVQVLRPFVDPRLSDVCFGSRPGKGREHALARAEALAARDGLWTWVAEDVRAAFDRVPVGRLLSLVRRHAPADDFIDLLKTVLRRPDERDGLRQGGALSPLLLNIYLDHLVDRPWARTHPDTPLIRFVDDLLVLAPDAATAAEARSSLRALLKAVGMPANPDKAMFRDLGAGAAIEWLGYALRVQDGAIEARLDDRHWEGLDEALTLAHDEPDAPIRAVQIVVGWLEQCGPCFVHEDVDAVLRRIVAVAQAQAFEELPGRDEMRSRWEIASTRWEDIRAVEKRATQPRAPQPLEPPWPPVKPTLVDYSTPPW